jgi:hypothetical protein
MAHSKAKRLTNDLISKSTLAQLIVLFSKANPASSKLCDSSVTLS